MNPGQLLSMLRTRPPLQVSALALPGMPEAMPVPLDPAAAAAAGDDGPYDALPVVRSSVTSADRQQLLDGRRPRYLDEQRGSDTPPSRELIEELGLRRAPSEPQPLETGPEPALPIHGAGSGGTGSSSLPLPVTPENSDGATALNGLEVVSNGSRPLVVEGEEVGAPVPASLTDSLGVGMYEVRPAVHSPSCFPCLGHALPVWTVDALKSEELSCCSSLLLLKSAAAAPRCGCSASSATAGPWPTMSSADASCGGQMGLRTCP